MRNPNASFKLDYYKGALGPTLLLRAANPVGIAILRDLFLELAKLPAMRVALREVDGFDVADGLDLVLEHSNVSSGPEDNLELLEGGNCRAFTLRFGSDEWERCADLMEGLSGGLGHQYLVEGNPATLKVSLLEYPWEKSFRG